MSDGPRSLKSFMVAAWTDGYMDGDYDPALYPEAVQRFTQSEGMRWVKDLPDMYKLPSGVWVLFLRSPDPSLEVSVLKPLTENFFMLVRPVMKEITDDYLEGVEELVAKARFSMMQESGQLPPIDSQEFN